MLSGSASHSTASIWSPQVAPSPAPLVSMGSSQLPKEQASGLAPFPEPEGVAGVAPLPEVEGALGLAPLPKVEGVTSSPIPQSRARVTPRSF